MKVPHTGAKPPAFVPPKAQKAIAPLEKLASASGPAQAAEHSKAVAELQHTASSAAAQQLLGLLQSAALAKPGPVEILAGDPNDRLAAGRRQMTSWLRSRCAPIVRPRGSNSS